LNIIRFFTEFVDDYYRNVKIGGESITAQLKNKLFLTSLAFLSALAIFSVVPSTIFLYIQGKHTLIIVELIIVLEFWLLLLLRRMNINLKKHLLIVTFYVLSIFFINESIESGLFLLMGVSLIALLIDGIRYGLICFFVNVLVCVSLISLNIRGESEYSFLFTKDISYYVILCVNFFSINIFELYFVWLLIKGLEKSYIAEHQLSLTLKHERNRLEDQKKKIEESERLKSSFIANMSHEIRTPLNAIVGFTNLVAKENDKEVRARYTDIVNDSSKKLTDLISNIMEISKVDADALSFVYNEIDLNTLLEGVKSEFSDYKNSKVNLRYNFNADGIRIKTDDAKLIKAIKNIIENSIKFTASGNITFTAGYDNVRKSLVFYIEDTGKGIDKSCIDKIFDPFYKIDENSPGVGVGLTVTKFYIDKLGGKIDVESVVNMGTLFKIVIPVDTL
jgi:signal transduction histidine kinase